MDITDEQINIAEHKAREILEEAKEQAKKILEEATLMSDEKVKEFLLQAVQSGKSETSGLVSAIFTKMDKKIGESVQFHINGKINGLTTKLDAYIKDDNEWKSKAEPVIKMGENAQGASKILLYLAGVILAIGGAYKILEGFFKK